MVSTNEQFAVQLKGVFIKYFSVSPDQFDWEITLEELDECFKLLGHLVYLEQLLQKEFQKEIPLLENIHTAYHTPKDILKLIEY